MTRLRPQHLLLALLAAACGSGPPAVDMMPPVELPGGDVAHVVGTPITIQDAINMVRIESNYGYDDKFLVFSPDGSKFATVVWHGDLERNVNVYSLLVFDTEEALANPRQRPRPIISIPFEGDESDQAASAITQLAILGDNRTVTFVGRLPGKVPQVYAVDIETGRLRALTDHPTPVKAYAVSDDGVLRLYAAAAPDPVDTARVNRILRDGISPYDRTVLPSAQHLLIVSYMMLQSGPDEVRQYFAPATRRGGEPRLIFDSSRSRRTKPSVWEAASDTSTAAVPRLSIASERLLGNISEFSVDPTGRYALLWPYILAEHSIDTLVHAAWNDGNLFSRSLAAYYGLIDLETGAIEPLLDQLYVPYLAAERGQFWAPDGRSVLIRSLLPLDAPTAAENEARAALPPAWLEVKVPSREYLQVPIPQGWSVIRWDAGTDELILRKADSLAVLQRVDGTWGTPRPIGVVAGFNRRHPAVTNGRVVIGIKDSLTVAPELAAYDLATGQHTILTDLNPRLRDRKYGEVELITFPTRYDSAAHGWLIKPVDYAPGRRYPLVVLHKDEIERPWDTSYLIDGAFNLSGHEIQPLAAAGMMVLFIGEPPSLRPYIESQEEGVRVMENTEAAIRWLARQGYVDTLRVGISGWSRAAYYTDYTVIHSRFPYAAATQIDGGTAEYNDRIRPFTDAELGRIRTPMLLEPHGLSLISAGAMANRLKAMGKPVDILYFKTAPHSTKQPRHRVSSLGTHLDWWRFWLQDYEDPAPEKRTQYMRWRELREQTAKIRRAGTV